MGKYDALYAKSIFKNRYRMCVIKIDSSPMKVLRRIGLVGVATGNVKIVQTNDTKEETKKFWENMGYLVISIEDD